MGGWPYGSTKVRAGRGTPLSMTLQPPKHDSLDQLPATVQRDINRLLTLMHQHAPIFRPTAGILLRRVDLFLSCLALFLSCLAHKLCLVCATGCAVTWSCVLCLVCCVLCDTSCVFNVSCYVLSCAPIREIPLNRDPNTSCSQSGSLTHARAHTRARARTHTHTCTHIRAHTHRQSSASALRAGGAGGRRV
jgi:hypothetical protein